MPGRLIFSKITLPCLSYFIILLMSNINNKRKIINSGFLNYAITLESDMLPNKVMEYLVKNVDFKNVPAKSLIKNYKLLSFIHESNITTEKLISIIYYNPETINYIETDKFNFKTQELIGLLVAHPDLMNFFKINYEELSFKQFINLFSLNETIKDKLDISKFKQETEDVRYAVKNFAKRKHVVDILDFSKMNVHEVREIIIWHGEEYIKKLKLDKLKPLDWFDIIKKRKEMLKYCDLNIFMDGDGYLLAKLITIYQDLDYLVEKNKDNFGALAWETLIIHNPDKYFKIADLSKLRDKNWTVIIKNHPQLRAMYFF